MGMGSRTNAPPLPTRGLPMTLGLKGVTGKDPVPMAPAAIKVLQGVVRPSDFALGHRIEWAAPACSTGLSLAASDRTYRPAVSHPFPVHRVHAHDLAFLSAVAMMVSVGL